MPNVQAQVVQHLKPGGIETMALDLLRCSDDDRDVHVISLEGRKDATLSSWPRLRPFADKLHFLNKPAGISPLTVLRLRSLLRRLGVRAVQTHHVGPLLYGGLAARLADVLTLVHTEHDAWHLQDRRRRALQDKLIKVLRPRLVADSDLVAGELARVLPGHDYGVIRNGVDCDLFSPGDATEARVQLSLPAGVPLVGCAGRMEPVKGHARLLEAHHMLPENVHLALAGGGSLEAALKDFACRLGTAERVHFLGHIDDMPRFYQSLDVFCLPSDREGMPLSPLEAQAVGIPCVATDVGGMREAVCPRTGLVVPIAHPAYLASGLELALVRRAEVSPRNYPLEKANLCDVVAAYQGLLMEEAA